MITAAALRQSVTSDGVLDLLRSLGYPVSPVPVDPAEWKRGGVPLPWADAKFSLVSRLETLDVFLLEGEVPHDMVHAFLRAYRRYNVATKSVVLRRDACGEVSLFDIDARDRLRRLDIDASSQRALDRVNLLARPDDDAMLPRVFDRALDRELLGREFFERFRDAVAAVRDDLKRACPAEDDQQCGSEALLILSRLLFLQFVQKKGWLDGERRFLVDRVAHAVRRKASPYATVLRPLFFGCLNTPVRRRDRAARKLGAIPYLNGGLFEPSPFERRNPSFDLPAHRVTSVLEDVFERFDFSAEEGDSAGTHIDPEMLGKVFESLMESDERLASGSYYTPRPIVEELTRKAIVEWLTGGDASLTPALLDACTGTGLDLDAGVAAGLLGRLEQLTILDPACGSGAFLLASLMTVEALYRTLASAARVEIPGELRRRIIEQSLFGVDLKPEAVRLCELRLWLSIVSATGENEEVAPLPNLDRNVMQGNSLLGPTDHLGDARADVYSSWIAALRAQRDLVTRYRNASQAERPALARLLRSEDLRIARELLERSIELDERALAEAFRTRRTLFGEEIPNDPARAALLQERIRHAKESLANVDDGELGFFAYDVHFAHVMAAGGFSIVAGNPPWVRNSRIDAKAKQFYADRYSLFRRAEGNGFHQPDLAIAFLERAMTLCRPGGVVAMLVPAKIANAGYATALRNFLLEAKAVASLHDWTGEGKRWFEADTFPLAVVLRNARPVPEHQTEIVALGERFSVPQSRIAGDRGVWRLVDRDVSSILDSLALVHPPLSIALGRRPLMGVKSGNNRAFFLGDGVVKGECFETSDGVTVPLEFVARCVRGRDVRRWSASDSQWFLWPPVNGWDDPPEWLRLLARKRECNVSDLRLAFVRPEHVGVQVVWKDLSRGMAAAVLPGAAEVGGALVPVIPNQTLYLLDAADLGEAWAIAAMLNSTVADALLLSVAERAKDDHYRYFGRTVAAMPFPADAWIHRRRELAASARAVHAGGDAEAHDRLVAESYGVSARDFEILRRFAGARLKKDAR